MELVGHNDSHLTRIEKKLNISISARGHKLYLTGKEEAVQLAQTSLDMLYARLQKGCKIKIEDVDASLRMIDHKKTNGHAQDFNYDSPAAVKTRKKNIVPFTYSQNIYMDTLKAKDIVFASGPAGTGKTYVAVAAAVSAFLERKVERIILTRPAVEAGEKLGFLPGDLKEKIDPYLRPLYDALFDMVQPEIIAKFIENGEIEIAPLAFMRGRTINNAYMILDEAQNTTPMQMKMFLTRMGNGSKIVVTGDPTQMDLPRDVKSGLTDAIEKLKNIDEIGIVKFSEKDIVRHPLTAKIVEAYKIKTENDEEKE